MPMRLTDEEKAMRDGERGAAIAKAMDLLIRYGEALGAEDFVYTNNIAGVPGSSPKWVKEYYAADGGDYRAVFSRFDLDSDEVVDVPAEDLAAREGPGYVNAATGYLANVRQDVQPMSTGGVLLPRST